MEAVNKRAKKGLCAGLLGCGGTGVGVADDMRF
jgi:hypothetical protein